MKLPIRHIHGDHYHLRTTNVPDHLQPKIDALHAHGYHFAVEWLGNRFDVVTVQRDGELHELDLAVVRKTEDFEPEVTKLVDRAYEVISHEVFPASDAVLTTPFTPFDGETVTNDEPPRLNAVRAVRHIDDIAWEDPRQWKVWE